MKLTHKKGRIRIRQKSRLNLLIGLSVFLTIGTISFILVFNFGYSEKSWAGGGNGSGIKIPAPNLSFHDPVLISGVDGQVNAIYKFSDVATGVDAQVMILALFNGARVDDMDHFTAGYYSAWQPFVAAPSNTTSWVDWRISFKISGTELDTVLSSLIATAVDVDGDGAYLKEIVAADNVLTYSARSDAPLSIVFNNDSCQVMSSFANIANIDTTQTSAMVMMIFKEVSSIEYRTGAFSTYGAEEVRQTSIYFKYFDFMPSPLPINLVSFNGNSTNQNTVNLKWETASEINNDYFTILRSTNGIDYKEIIQIKGSGNTTSESEYYTTDQNPSSATNYYKLVQTDFDGKSKSFDPICIKLNEKMDDQFKILSVFPNPCKDYLKITCYSKKNSKINLTILNNKGEAVYQEKLNSYEGTNLFIFSDLFLPKGLYFLTAYDENKINSLAKFLVN